MSKNVALVLSGGGARGIAHIGVIEELEKQGYNITSISGTSMGALVGGIYASGNLPEFKNWLCGLTKQDVFGLLDFSFSTQGLIKGDKVFNVLKKYITDKEIQELPIQYSANAFDILENKEVVFNTGSLFNAIRASVSIPTVFTPIISGNSALVDGGVANNIPINHVFRNTDDILIAVNVNANIPYNQPEKFVKSTVESNSYFSKLKDFRIHFFKEQQNNGETKLSFFNLMTKTIAAMIHQMSAMVIEQHPPDVLVEVSKDASEMYDFFKAEELVEAGRQEMEKSLQNYQLG